MPTKTTKPRSTNKGKTIKYPDERQSASDSATSAKEVVAAVAIQINPPDHIALNDIGLAYFDHIITERANADWAPHDIAMAAKLAKKMQREDELEELLDAEGPTIEGAQGGVIKNPTATVLSDTTGKIIALRRSLGLQSGAGGVRSIDLKARRGQRKAMQSAAETQDPLLAAPRG